MLKILCYKNQGIHWYPCNPTFLSKINFTLVRRLISASIFWSMESFRQSRFQRKTDCFFKISDAIHSNYYTILVPLKWMQQHWQPFSCGYASPSSHGNWPNSLYFFFRSLLGFYINKPKNFAQKILYIFLISWAVSFKKIKCIIRI